MNPILAVCKDPGGMNGLLPVVQALRQHGLWVTLVTNGIATERVPRTLSFTHAVSPQEALAVNPSPAALITSMCSGGGIGRDLVAHLRGSCPTICLEDFWGGGQATDWADRQFRPDYICVNDQLGADITARTWTDFDIRNIHQTGYPALDKYAAMDRDLLASQGREFLNVASNVPVVLFAGQLIHSAHALGEVAAALEQLHDEIGLEVCLVARPHPRMPQNALAEVVPWETVLRTFRAGRAVWDSSACEMPALIAASKVVLSMYSTTLVEACCLRRDNIAVLYPETGMAAFRQDVGGLMDEPPFVSLSCTAQAGTRDQLVDLLRWSLTDSLELTANQERHFRQDGQNAERVADVVLSLLTK